ncbi:MAG: hypothetical protein AABX13_01445 [Nanoarchaeota archaeon]
MLKPALRAVSGSAKPLISFFLRLGIAIPFLYAAIAATLDPNSWLGFFPGWLQSLFPSELLLGLFSLYQLGLSLWLLSGKKSYYAGFLACLTLLAIIITNLGALDIVFRDLGLLLAAIALTILSRAKQK